MPCIATKQHSVNYKAVQVILLRCKPSWPILQEEAFVEISGDDMAGGDAFAELVSMAVEVEPSLADRASRDLVGSRRASASVAGALHCHRLQSYHIAGLCYMLLHNVGDLHAHHQRCGAILSTLCSGVCSAAGLLLDLLPLANTPGWLRLRAPKGERQEYLNGSLHSLKLHTVLCVMMKNCLLLRPITEPIAFGNQAGLAAAAGTAGGTL
jgi:hypothetical protein